MNYKSMVCVFAILFSALSSRLEGQDVIFVQALARQIKIWDARLANGTGSQEGREVFKRAIAAMKAGQDLIEEIRLVESAWLACTMKKDSMGLGIASTYKYMRLSTLDQKWDASIQLFLDPLKNTEVLLNSEHTDPILEASLLGRLTEYYHYAGQFDKVVELSTEAERRFQTLGIEASVSLAIALSNTGYVKRRALDFQAALDYYQRSIKMLKKLEPPAKKWLAHTYRRIALVFDKLGQRHRAIANCDSALTIYRWAKEDLRVAEVAFNKGVTLFDLALYDQGIDAFTEAEEVWKQIGQEVKLGNVYYNLGKCWYEKGEAKTALNYYNQAERLLESNKAYRDLAMVYVSQGILYENQLDKSSYFEALKIYDKIEQIYDEHAIGDPTSRGILAINRGKAFERLGLYDAAYKQYLEADTLIHVRRQLNVYTNVYHNLAYISSKLRNYDEALSYADKAIAVLEEISRDSFIIGGESSIKLWEQRGRTYHTASQIHLALGNLSKSYQLLDETRNRIFQMQVRLKAPGAGTQLTESLWQQKIELEKQLSDIDLQASQLTTASKRATITSKQADLGAERKRVLSELRAIEQRFFDNTETYERVFKQKQLNVPKIQMALETDEVLIDYFISGEYVPAFYSFTNRDDIIYNIQAFVLKKDTIAYIDLFPEEDAYDTVILLQDYTHHLTPQSLPKASDEEKLEEYNRSLKSTASLLYEKLLKKIEPHLEGINKLVIIPHGQLHYMPFETLIDESGRLLVEKYAVSYINSATDVLSGQSKTNDGMLIYGNIDYGDKGNDGRGANKILGTEDILAKVRNIAKQRMKVKYVERSAATETNFKAESAGHEWVLIWTHGFYNNYSPPSMEFLNPQINRERLKSIQTQRTLLATMEPFSDPLSHSHLLFANVNEGGDINNNGYLTAREVLGLNLSGTELTILAACETGLGQSTSNEGVMGLKRAFLIAGSQHLLTSLWQVRADWTGELIIKMLQNDSQNQGMARALQNAKLEIIQALRKEGLEPFPFYWAGFVLVGRGD